MMWSMAIIDPTYLIDDHTLLISPGKGSHDKRRAPASNPGDSQ